MRDNYYYEPEMNVSFSPDGYYKTLSCPSAKILFSGVWSEDKQTINGCPFKIDINQKSDFIVKMAQKIKGDIYE